jgi:hypothetical protein
MSKLITVTITNRTAYSSLSYYDDQQGWIKLPFGQPRTLQGKNPPGLIEVFNSGGPPQQLNIADTDPPQPSFTDGIWEMVDGKQTVPSVTFIKGAAKIHYRAYF